MNKTEAFVLILVLVIAVIGVFAMYKGVGLAVKGAIRTDGLEELTGDKLARIAAQQPGVVASQPKQPYISQAKPAPKPASTIASTMPSAITRKGTLYGEKCYTCVCAQSKEGSDTVTGCAYTGLSGYEVCRRTCDQTGRGTPVSWADA